MSDDLNSTFNFNVTGLDSIKLINDALAKHNATIEDVTKIYKKFNKDGDLVSATLKGLTTANKNFVATIQKTEDGMVAAAEAMEKMAVKGSKAINKYKKEIESLNKVKMAQGVGASGSSAQDYTNLAARLAKLRTRLIEIRNLEIDSPEGRQARQAKIQAFQEQIRLTKERIALAKEELQLAGRQATKDASDYEKAVKKQARDAKVNQERLAVSSVPMAAGVGQNNSAAMQYTNLTERLNKLREQMLKLRELDIDTAEGKKARRDRIRDFQEQIRLTKQRITLAKEELQLTSQQARKAAADYEKAAKAQAKQVKVNQDRARVQAVPAAQPYNPNASTSSAENYIDLTKRLDQLKTRLIALRNLELDTAQGKQYRREKIQYTQESIRSAQKRIDLLKEDLRLTGQQAIKEAENIALRQRYRNITGDVSTLRNQTQTGMPAGLSGQKQYLDQFLAVKKQLIAADQKLAAIQKSQYATPKDTRRIQLVRDYIAALKQEADAEIKVAKAAVIKGNAQAKQKQVNDSKFFLNLDNAARVGQFILLHRVFMGFAGAIKQGATEAREFSIRIGEIRTISDRSATSTEQWTQAIRNLSSSFGEDLGTTARGIYEAISNQVVKSANDISFFEQNMKLAKTTVATFDEAINATTSVINAFGMSVADTEEIAGILFKTVDIGRVHLSEMANTLGRVSILSNALGVSFKEQQAALAALSIQGVKHATAETYLTNIFQKMIRPSERMEEIYAEMGVSSGEVALKTFSLAGWFEILGDVTRESGDEMAEMGNIMQRIRSTTGSVALSQDKLNFAYAKMADSTRKAKEAYEEMYNTIGARLDRQTQALKNMFAIDVGAEFNKTILKIADSFGGLANAVINTTSAVAGFIAMWLVFTKAAKIGAAFVAIAEAASAARMAIAGTTVATAAFGTAAAWATGGISLLVGGAVFLVTKLATAGIRLQETIRLFQQSAAKARENSTAYTELKTSIDSFTDTQTKSTQTIRQNIAGFAAASYKELKRTEASFKDIVRYTGYAIDSTKDLASAAVDKVKESVDEMRDSIKEAHESIRDATFESAEALFGNTLDQLGFWATTAGDVIDNKLVAIQDRMQELSKVFNEANAGLYGKKGGKMATDAVKEYQTLIQESKAYEEQLKQVDKVGEQALKNQIEYANQEASKLFRAGVDASGKATTPEQQELAQKQIELAEKMFAKRNEMLDQYTEKYETDLSTAQQRMLGMQQEELFVIQQKAVAQEQYIKLTQVALDKAEEDRIKKEAALRDLEFALSEIGKFDYKKGTKEEFNTLGQRVFKALDEGKFDPEKKLDILMRLQENYYKQVEQGALQSNQELAKYTQQQISFIEEQFEASKVKIKDLENGQKNSAEGLTRTLIEQSKIFENTFSKERLNVYKNILSSPGKENSYATSELESMKKLVEGYDELQRIISVLHSPELRSAADLEKMYNTMLEIGKLSGSEATKNIGPWGTSTADIEQGVLTLKQAYELMQQSNIPYQLAVDQSEKLAQLSIDLVNSQMYLNNLGDHDLEVQRQLIEAYRKQLELMQLRGAAITGALPGVGVGAAPGMALGGTRGNDRRIVAMDPREFIVNAEASRTYAPFLKAINSNRIPHFAQGGSVTNVGDIQVSVAGGATSAQTIQEIAQGINREIRLGRIKLNVR